MAEVMVGLGLAFALWRELGTSALWVFIVQSAAVGMLLLRRRAPVSKSECIVVVLVAAVLAALCSAKPLPRSDPFGNRECSAQLISIATALRSYHDLHGCFPPAVVRDAAGRPLHSWRTLIMPHMEYASNFRDYNFGEPWDSTDNRIFATRVRGSGYWPGQCPTTTSTKVILPTQYCYIVGPGRTNDHDQLPTFAQIEAADGAVNTILLVEEHGLDVDWFEPRDLSIDEALRGVNQPGGPGISSPHKHEERPAHWYRGAHVVTVDGQVHFLPDALDQGTLRALLLIDDGQPIDWSRIRLPDRRPVIIWLIALTVLYVAFLYWRHWPRRAPRSAADLIAKSRFPGA
jgi:hypothetical protein